ncbi:hypothetical protein [Pedobacter sp.]|uniref:hypothetical protein n=1 Tax=Pedobacter sp. TaxID=1411316 RepID=UPI003BAB2874
MNQKKIKPQLLWDLYHISSNRADEILVALGFSLNKKVENLILYRNYDEGFILTEEAGVITKVQYRMKEEVTYHEFIEYARGPLAFETIFERFEPSAEVLRLDDETCSLVCIIITINGNHQSLEITLLNKLPYPTPENKVEVILAPPPTSKEKPN